MGPHRNRLEELLTNLVIERRAPTGWVPHDDDLNELIGGLEDALLDRDALRLVLSHLQAAGVGAGEPELLAERETEAVFAAGLRALYVLSPERFFLAVVDPLLLLSLRDALLEELPPYWWERARGRSRREPLTADAMWATAVEQAGRESTVAALDRPSGVRRRVETAPSDHVVRIAPAGAAPPSVDVEFTLTSRPDGWHLSVELLNPPPLPGSRWSGRLISGTHTEIGFVENVSGPLTFVLPDPELLVGGELHCDYHRREQDHIRFRVHVPAL